MSAVLAWLRRRDPQFTAVRRAARVTLVACLGFYLCRYVLGNAAMAPYALFGAVALGALSQIPGCCPRRPTPPTRCARRGCRRPSGPPPPGAATVR